MLKKYPYFYDQKYAGELISRPANATVINKLTGIKTRFYNATEAESKKMIDDYTNYEINFVVEHNLREASIPENMKCFDWVKFEAALIEFFGDFSKTYVENEFPIIIVYDDGKIFDGSDVKTVKYTF